MNPLEYAKKHPFIVGGSVIAVFALWFLFTGGEEAQPSTALVPMGPSDAQIASNTQMSMAQLQASTAVKQIDAAREVQLAEIAAAQEIDRYRTETSFNANVLAGNIALADIAAGREVSLADINATRQISLADIALATRRSDNELRAFQASQATIQQQQSLTYGAMMEGYRVQEATAMFAAETQRQIAGYTAQQNVALIASQERQNTNMVNMQTYLANQQIQAGTEGARIASNLQIELSKPRGLLSFLLG